MMMINVNHRNKGIKRDTSQQKVISKVTVYNNRKIQSPTEKSIQKYCSSRLKLKFSNKINNNVQHLN